MEFEPMAQIRFITTNAIWSLTYNHIWHIRLFRLKMYQSWIKYKLIRSIQSFKKQWWYFKQHRQEKQTHQHEIKMKSLLYFVMAALVLQMVACGLMEELKDEFAAVDSALEGKALEKELRSIPLPSEVKKDANKAESVEAQLKDVLDSIGEDKKSEKKDELEYKDLHDILQKFEKSDSIDKAKLLDTIENIIKKEVISSDVAKDTSGECKDTRPDCLALARSGYCGTHEDDMRQTCGKTCQFCVRCVNLISDSKCKSFAKYGYCTNKDYKERMKKLCFKGCEYCSKAHLEVRECGKSKYGCCWDKKTTKIDKAGKSCPPCKDNYKRVCGEFKGYCMSNGKAGEFMRQFCPDKCGVCHVKCSDDFKYKEKCPTYRKLGWCKTLKHSMKVLCEKTCGFC